MIVGEENKVERPRKYSEEKAKMDKLIKVMVIMVALAVILSIVFLIIS